MIVKRQLQSSQDTSLFQRWHQVIKPEGVGALKFSIFGLKLSATIAGIIDNSTTFIKSW
jgi:hypothetical protein